MAYEFTFETPKSQIASGFLGAIGSALFATFLGFASTRLIADGRLALLAGVGGAALVVICLLALRRALLLASVVRLGEAGLYIETITEQRYIGWDRVVRIGVRRGLLRLVFRAEKGLREVWAQVGDAHAAHRLEVFLRARATQHGAPHGPARHVERAVTR